MFHKVNLLSKPLENTYLESNDIAQELISFLDPKNLYVHLPVFKDHNLIDLSQDDDNK